MSESKKNNKLKETIIEVIEDIFENMLFMDAIYKENPENDDIINSVEVRLLVNHPFPGEFVFKAPKQFISEAAGTLFMAEEGDIDEKMFNDVMSELLNTISGRIMAKITPEDKSFKLGLPEQMQSQSFILDNDDSDLDFFFEVDDEFIINIKFYDMV